MTAAATQDRPLTTRARDALKRAGNPFRNYFARNPDDEVCARYHVPELFAAERDLLHSIIDLYRYDPHAHSEVVPILGNKGAGKTHLLHSIKHGTGGQWQLLVTPGVYQKDTDFLEYLLFQIIDTLLGRRQAEGRAAACLRRRPARPQAARRGAEGPDARPADGTVPAAGPRQVGQAARPRRRPGRRTRRVAGDRPVADGPVRPGTAAAGANPRRQRADAREGVRPADRTRPEDGGPQHGRRHAAAHRPRLRPRRAARRRSRPGQLHHLRVRGARVPGPPRPARLGSGAVQGADRRVPQFEGASRRRLRPVGRLVARPAVGRRPQDGRGVLRRHRPGDAPDRRPVLPDLRRARPMEPVRAEPRRVHPGPAQQPGPRAEGRDGQGDPARSPQPEPDPQRGGSPPPAGAGRGARTRRSAGPVPVRAGTGGAHRQDGADAPRHAPAVPPPVRPPDLRPGRRHADPGDERYSDGGRTAGVRGKFRSGCCRSRGWRLR